MKTKKIQEGMVTLRVPEARIPEEGDVFYNPKMAFDRSLSVCFSKLVKPEKTLDALSATGIRALRYRKEAKIDVVANDCNPKASKLIEKNVQKNGIEIMEKDANALMREEHFEFVDLDPFGSPISFIDSACASIGKKGFLAFTATDKAPLCGTYPKVSERRYGIRSMKTDYYNEMGLRILLSAVMRIFNRYERRFTPLLSYSRLHYFRVYGKVEKGVKRVNRQLRDFGWVSHCFRCGWRGQVLKQKCPKCGSDTGFCKVYLGEIQDTGFLDKILKELQSRMFVQEEKLVDKVRQEAPFPLYYDLHYLYKKTGCKPEKMNKTLQRLEEKGFRASRTHFCPTAIKTNASFSDMVKIIQL